MKYFPIVLLFLLFVSCSGNSSQDAYESGFKAEEASFSQDSEQPADQSVKQERKIIKTAEMRFQVKDLKASTQKVEALTKQYSGFISGMNKTNSDYSISNYLTIRVPADKLDEFIAAAEQESIYTNYTRINARDVTEEFVDVTVRLNNKKEVRDRYIDILRNKAQSVKDILEAEEKIRVIQEEIESAEGRLKYLNDQTTLSTVNIEMYQEVEYVRSPDVYRKPFFTKIQEAFVDGWKLIQEIVLGLIMIWPVILLLIVILVWRKKIVSIFRR